MKIFKGKIVIIRAKSNSGIVVLDEGGQSQMMTFDPIYDDGDRVEVSFKNDNPKNEIYRIDSISDEIFYGIIMNFNEQTKSGVLSCNYPKNKGEIPFQISNFVKPDEIDAELFVPGYQLYKRGLKIKDFLMGFINFDTGKKGGSNVQFSIHKDDKRIFAFNIKILKTENSNIYKCFKPIIGKMSLESFKTQKGTKITWFFYNEGLKKRAEKAPPSLKVNFLRGKFQVKPDFYKNFLMPKGNKIYYMYGLGNKSEIFELNENSKSELIQCFEAQDTSNEIKLKVIDQLLKFDLKHYGISHSNLINDKIERLKQLIEDCQDDYLLKRYAFELMKLDYSIDYIKSYDSGKTNLSSLLNNDVDFDFQSSNSQNWNLTKIDDIEEGNDPGYNLSDSNWYLGK